MILTPPVFIYARFKTHKLNMENCDICLSATSMHTNCTINLKNRRLVMLVPAFLNIF